MSLARSRDIHHALRKPFSVTTLRNSSPKASGSDSFTRINNSVSLPGRSCVPLECRWGGTESRPDRQTSRHKSFRRASSQKQHPRRCAHRRRIFCKPSSPGRSPAIEVPTVRYFNRRPAGRTAIGSMACANSRNNRLTKQLAGHWRDRIGTDPTCASWNLCVCASTIVSNPPTDAHVPADLGCHHRLLAVVVGVVLFLAVVRGRTFFCRPSRAQQSSLRQHRGRHQHTSTLAVRPFKLGRPAHRVRKDSSVRRTGAPSLKRISARSRSKERNSMYAHGMTKMKSQLCTGELA
jgi:hypothetical protein